jgi:hypothetical protein
VLFGHSAAPERTDGPPIRCSTRLYREPTTFKVRLCVVLGGLTCVNVIGTLCMPTAATTTRPIATGSGPCRSFRTLPARHRTRLPPRRLPLGRARRDRFAALVSPPAHPLGDPRRHPPGVHHPRLRHHLLATPARLAVTRPPVIGLDFDYLLSAGDQRLPSARRVKYLSDGSIVTWASSLFHTRLSCVAPCTRR